MSNDTLRQENSTLKDEVKKLKEQQKKQITSGGGKQVSSGESVTKPKKKDIYTIQESKVSGNYSSLQSSQKELTTLLNKRANAWYNKNYTDDFISDEVKPALKEIIDSILYRSNKLKKEQVGKDSKYVELINKTKEIIESMKQALLKVDEDDRKSALSSLKGTVKSIGSYTSFRDKNYSAWLQEVQNTIKEALQISD
jgi:hypothetical protein